MSHGLSPRDIQEIVGILKEFPAVEQAILFGSRAKGNYRPGSDVDIAIKGQSIGHSCVSRLSSMLNEESLLPYFFDIVHFEQISDPDLIQHIVRVGEPFYQRSSSWEKAESVPHPGSPPARG
ncbi:nucleotidyltransferase domain-containing protein [Desulfobulbus rhabdoformis]|uniref:nucleotidyltransferase domain-containing protein n=1 Tax=Desulfobulbus rhabdoformis TaxID=34032 RepID=UPI0019644AD6|nr:nucleotidyltransferase domain-containing protein [Desulfobulbus rhabdoformis]MBM9612713.1 nucleotidyltransferase domain-containing protein [Desulfobulbus rhabdoformis]